MKPNAPRNVKIANVCHHAKVTAQEAERALSDCGWNVDAAVDYIRRKMPIKRGAS
mgnify:CR=1 FL=1